MTKREFLNAVVAMENVEEEVRAYATEELEKMDVRALARKDKPTKTQIENEALVAKICEMFAGEEDVLSSAVAKKMDISIPKASALCKQAVKENKATVKDVIEKKSVKKAYTFA